MLELVILQLTNYITMQYPVIKYEVCKIVFVIYDDTFLTIFEAKSLT